MANRQPAPIYLNLLRIRFPVGAVTSIAHRISGVLMFVALPLLVYLLGLSLQSQQGFERALDYLNCGWIRLASALILWSVFHHLLSGVRFLFIDTGRGVSHRAARRSAWLVNIAGLLLTLAYLWWLL